MGSELRSGDRVVVIEDVTTSGASIEETFPIIKAQGDVQVKGLIVSLNRMERGKNSEKSALDEIQETYGFPAASIVTMRDVIDALDKGDDSGIITREIRVALDEYYAQWGAK